MDGTASGINSSDTMEADIGEPIEERELISEIEGENHGLSITNLCLSFSESVTYFILIVLSSETLEHFVSLETVIDSTKVSLNFLSSGAFPSDVDFLLLKTPDFFLL